jgi:hypothetical protein
VTHFCKLIKQILTSGSFSRENTGQLDHYFEDANQAHRLIDLLIQTVNDHSSTLQSAILEAIPNWSMPHNSERLAPQCLKDSLYLVEQAIEMRAKEYHSAPFLITIARSTSDGFTPDDVVEFLQGRILAIIDKIFCQEGNIYFDTLDYAVGNPPSEVDKNPRYHRIRIVRDYAQWEGSTL